MKVTYLLLMGSKTWVSQSQRCVAADVLDLTCQFQNGETRDCYISRVQRLSVPSIDILLLELSPLRVI